MNEKTYKNFSLKQYTNESSITAKIPVLAYMDDMVWLVQSIKQLFSMMSKVQQFMDLTGLTINYAKSDLIKLITNSHKRTGSNEN